MTGKNSGVKERSDYSADEQSILHKIKNALIALQVDEDEVWDYYMKYKDNLGKRSNAALMETIRGAARDHDISIKVRIENAIDEVLK